MKTNNISKESIEDVNSTSDGLYLIKFTAILLIFSGICLYAALLFFFMLIVR